MANNNPAHKLCAGLLKMKGGDIAMLNTEIGKTAGLVWEHLGKNGRCSIQDLRKKIGVDVVLFYQAIGWLARENKICHSKEAENLNVQLTDYEMSIYNQAAGHKKPEPEGRI